MDHREGDKKDWGEPGQIAGEVGGILDAISDRIPRLLGILRDALFSEEAGRHLGRAVGAFYKELAASGVPETKAVEMAQTYLSTIQTAMSQLRTPGRTVRVTSPQCGEGPGPHETGERD